MSGEAVLEVDETRGRARHRRVGLERPQFGDQVLACRAQGRVGGDDLDHVIAALQLDRRPDLGHARKPLRVASDRFRLLRSAADRELDRGIAEGRELGPQRVVDPLRARAVGQHLGVHSGEMDAEEGDPEHDQEGRRRDRDPAGHAHHDAR